MGIYDDIQDANKKKEEIMKSSYNEMSDSNLIKHIGNDIEKGKKARIGEVRKYGDYQYKKVSLVGNWDQQWQRVKEQENKKDNNKDILSLAYELGKKKFEEGGKAISSSDKKLDELLGNTQIGDPKNIPLMKEWYRGWSEANMKDNNELEIKNNNSEVISEIKETSPLYSIKKLQSDFPKVKISKSEDAADFIRQFYGDDLEVFESMFLLLLDRQNNTIGYAKISQGGVSGTICDPKLILKYAVDSLASGCIMCHNHPSGNLQPSDADLAVGRRIKTALEIIDSKLLDNMILTKDSYYSVADKGGV